MLTVSGVDPADPDRFDAWFGVVDAAHRADRPHEPGWQRQELHAMAVAGTDPQAPARNRLLLVEADGAAVGAARLDLPTQDNRDLAELTLVSVDPARRRQGVGTALLRAGVEAAREQGRRDLVVGLEEHGAPSPGGRALAERSGLVASQVEVRRDLRVPVDAARLDALEERCRGHAEGYAVRLWEGECPADLLEDRALLSQRMSTDAPAGDVPRGEEHWDAARVRFGERLLREQGRVRLSAGAVHEASGRLVAFTDLCVPTAAPERAYQWDTLVLREHRGHRLGTLVKLANLRRVPAAWPRTRVVSTWNAEENTPMIAVNEALGCEVTATTTVYRLAL